MEKAIAAKREVAALLLAVAVLTGCATTAPDPAPAAGAGGAGTDAVEQAAAEGAAAVEPLVESSAISLWETEPRPEDGLAGLAVWPGAGQRPWLLVAARDSHRLVLFDAASGELLREFGALGERPGSFREPVDVAVAGDLAFVVERGNARVQVLRLPGLATVGFLGEGVLERPAAVAVERAGEGWGVWVLGVEHAEEDGEPRLTLRGFAVAADGSPAASPGSENAVAPLDVARRLAGAVRYPCAATADGSEPGGWLEPSAGGEVVAAAGDEGVAVLRLAVEGVGTVAALAVAAPPAVAPPPGTLWVVTGDSRVVAVAADELAAAVAQALCR